MVVILSGEPLNTLESLKHDFKLFHCITRVSELTALNEKLYLFLNYLFVSQLAGLALV